MRQHLWIPGKLPGLNDLLAASGSHGGGKRRFNKYNIIKRHWAGVVHAECLRQDILPIERAWFDFIWYEKSRRRDPDNIAAAGRKLLLDALVSAGILPNDGWKQVAGWRDKFICCADCRQGEPGVMIVIDGE